VPPCLRGFRGSSLAEGREVAAEYFYRYCQQNHTKEFADSHQAAFTQGMLDPFQRLDDEVNNDQVK